MARDLKGCKLSVVFADGREMLAEVGVTFTGTDASTGKSQEYICFTDHKTTGSFIAKKRYIYYFKIDPDTKQIHYSDRDSGAESVFVAEMLGQALNCPPKGLTCLFELVRGGIRSVELLEYI